MNVLLANDGSLDHGGVCVFMLQWIKGVKKADIGSNVYVYFRDCVIDQEMEESFKSYGACICLGNIPRSIKFSNKKAREKVEADIISIIKDKQIDILHINTGIYGFTADLLSIAKKNDVPMRIAHFHGSYPENLVEKIIHLFLRLKIKAAVTDYAGCSKEAAEVFFGKKSVCSSKWQFIPNAIPTDKIKFNLQNREKYRKLVRINDDEVLLGAVGRLTVGKNHKFLIDVLVGLKERKMQAKLLILGDGLQMEDLKAYADQCNVEKDVLLPGAVNDVPGWLSAFDYYMMPSRSEGLPISAIEAQANGLVCFLSDKITTETDLTDSVYHLSIDEGVESWISSIMHTKPTEIGKRINGYLTVKQSGFDEEDTPKYVKELYRAF